MTTFKKVRLEIARGNGYGQYIVIAEYKGKLIYAFPFSQEVNSNKTEFFDEQGKTLKNFFLKAPLKFVNITKITLKA
jgi:hypothetical protein